MFYNLPPFSQLPGVKTQICMTWNPMLIPISHPGRSSRYVIILKFLRKKLDRRVTLSGDIYKNWKAVEVSDPKNLEYASFSSSYN